LTVSGVRTLCVSFKSLILNGAKLRWRSLGVRTVYGSLKPLILNGTQWCLRSNPASTQGGSTQWTPLIFLTERKTALLSGCAFRRARPRQLVDEGRLWRGRAGRRYRQTRRPNGAIPAWSTCSGRWCRRKVGDSPALICSKGVCGILQTPRRRGVRASLTSLQGYV
jgi:hypothetical protein